MILYKYLGEVAVVFIKEIHFSLPFFCVCGGYSSDLSPIGACTKCVFATTCKMDDFLFLMIACDTSDFQLLFFMLQDLNYLNSMLLLLVLVPERSHIHLWFRNPLSSRNKM